MKSVNIKELARELNLAVSTISKALHDSHEISDKTKRLVIETAAKLNYIPHPYASGLRGRKSGNIAVVIPEVADSFFALAINGIESIVKEKGYHVLIYLSHEDFEKEKAILKECQGGRVDGVLMSVSQETSDSKHISDLINSGVPVVFFDRVCEDVETATITTDDLESSYTATKHMIEQGCRNLAFLSTSAKLSISSKRMEGFILAHKENNRLVNEQQMVLCDNEFQKNYSRFKQLLQQKDRFDGFLASVEKLTAPVYQACADLNLKIPEDVKVVAFSNLETAAFLHPSLTTIAQPSHQMGAAAAKTLIACLEKPNAGFPTKRVVIGSALEIRGSTAEQLLKH